MITHKKLEQEDNLLLELFLCQEPRQFGAKELRPGHREMMEADEMDGTQPGIGQAYGLIQPASPVHMGDSPSGGSDWVSINSQFNEPRTGTIFNTHKGMDFHTSLGNGTRIGRPVFATSSGYVSRAQWDGSYGNMVEISHTLNINGVQYQYRDRYAHLNTTEVTTNQSVGTTTRIGLTGESGLTCQNPCDHLHLEFLANTAQDSLNGGPSSLRRYAPTVFYNNQAPANWGLNSSWITRVTAPTNQASFRLTVASDYASATYSNVKLWYSFGGYWQTARYLTQSGDIFTVNFVTEGVPYGNSVQFYVEATSNGFNGVDQLVGFRPWRNNIEAGSGKPLNPPGGPTSPDARPFTMLVH